MKALVWHGRNDVRIDNVPDPEIKEANDIIIKITSTMWKIYISIIYLRPKIL